MNKCRSKEEILQILSRWRASGLTRRSFCEREQLSFGTFISWIKKYRQQSVEYSSTIVPLQINDIPVSPSTELEVEYPNGVRLRLSSMPSTEELGRIIHIF